MVTSTQPYTVAVRALCEFTAKVGDLDLRFTPSPSAAEGIAGHALVRTRRSADYETEIALSGDFEGLHVRGRADGFDPKRHRLEEIKTYRGELSQMRDNHRQLHWAQVKIYGWLLCEARQFTQLDVALVYLEIGSRQETVLTETWTASALKAYFDRQCALFLAWGEQEVAHRAERDEALRALSFPHADFRTGQRQLAEAIYRAAAGQRRLLAQAPTGIGKTIGSLFPMLKACPSQSIDKIFYLAAKTSGRSMAMHAISQISQAAAMEVREITEVNARQEAREAEQVESVESVEHIQQAKKQKPIWPLRVVELVARDKACEHPDKACHGESCPLARGFYDRLPAARGAALKQPILNQATLRATALEAEVCPYYLAQEMVRWSDVVVGDYNYYFDLNALLAGLTQANQWRVSLLIDEAHNLLDRARGMYSADLSLKAFSSARRQAPASARRTFTTLARHWKQLDESASFSNLQEDFLPALQNLISALSDAAVATPLETTLEITPKSTTKPPLEPDVLRCFFDATHFARIAELFDQRRFSARIVNESTSSPQLTLRNIIPAELLKPRFAMAHSVVLFSATLTPWSFYADTLGLPADSVWVDVDSPFRAEQLSVQVVESISTRWQHREASLSALVDVMAQQFRKRPGNYLGFFSSYDYLQRAAELLRARHPEIPVREQASGMREHEQQAFLAAFTDTSQAIGLAVLGGAFSEGVDLPGDRLIGAFIATLGLPQWSAANEEIKTCMASNYGNEHAYDYAYLFPGLRKVVQAAGRVIRTTNDTGTVFLLDDRFSRPDVRRLLPKWWEVSSTATD